MLFNLPNNYVLLFQTYFLTPSCFFKLQDENPDEDMNQANSEENIAEERPEENIPENQFEVPEAEEFNIPDSIHDEVQRIEENLAASGNGRQNLFNWMPYTKGTHP